MPESIGGMAAIYKSVVAPADIKSGKVYLILMVNENGSVDDARVVKGIGDSCNEAALQAVKKVKFTPGKNKGVPVKVKLALAIEFKS